MYHSSTGAVTVKERKETPLGQGLFLVIIPIGSRWCCLPLPGTHCHCFNNGLLTLAMISVRSSASDKCSLITGLFLNKYLLDWSGLGLYLFSPTFSNILRRWPTTVLLTDFMSLLHLAKLGLKQPQGVCPPAALSTLGSVPPTVTALFCSFLPDRLSSHTWPCPLTSAIFIPKGYLDLQERVRLMSAFQFLFTGPSWDAHVSLQPLEPSLYPRSSRSSFSPFWASRASGSHHPVIRYLGLLTNYSLEGLHLLWVGREASGQVELGPYTFLTSPHSRWYSTMHGSPQNCVMDTPLRIPASLTVRGKAHKVPHFDGSCQLPTIFLPQADPKFILKWKGHWAF